MFDDAKGTVPFEDCLYIANFVYCILSCIIMQKLLNCLCTKRFSFYILKYIIATDVARHVASLYQHLSFLYFFTYVHTHSIIYPLRFFLLSFIT